MIYQVTFHPLAKSREMKAIISVDAEQPDEAVSIAEWRLENMYLPARKRSNFRKQVKVIEVTEMAPIIINQELVA